MSSTLYDILGIPSSAQSEEIKTAYKQLAKKHHPDKNPGEVWHEEQFKKINQAYQILSDPYKKKQYDNRLEYEAFQKQNPTSSSANTRQPYKRTQPPKRPVKKDPWSGYKMYLVIAGVFLFTGILGYFFYNFMNHYTAQDLFLQAKAMDDRARYKEAFMLYTDALSFDKEYSEAYEKRGDARINAIGDYKSAEFDYTNAIVNTDKPSGNLYFKRAKCLLELKKYNLALIDLDSIVTRDKTFDSAFFYKAEVNYFLENYQQAIPAYTSFLTLHPDASEAILKRGFCYYKTEQFENALGDFDQILRIQPQDAETFYYRGITRFALKDSLQGCNDLNYSYLFGFTEASGVQKKYCK